MKGKGIFDSNFNPLKSYGCPFGVEIHTMSNYITFAISTVVIALFIVTDE